MVKNNLKGDDKTKNYKEEIKIMRKNLKGLKYQWILITAIKMTLGYFFIVWNIFFGAGYMLVVGFLSCRDYVYLKKIEKHIDEYEELSQQLNNFKKIMKPLGIKIKPDFTKKWKIK